MILNGEQLEFNREAKPRTAKSQLDRYAHNRSTKCSLESSDNKTNKQGSKRAVEDQGVVEEWVWNAVGSVLHTRMRACLLS
jgi:hypothetical protein